MENSTLHKPLRLWPGVAIVLLQWLVRFVVPVVLPDAVPFAVFGGLFAGLAVIVWWTFFSRAPWPDRGGAVLLILGALAATPHILHESIETAMFGMMFYIYIIPVLSFTFVAWVVVSRRFSTGFRRLTMAATILLTCGLGALFRTDGFSTDGTAHLAWRWAPTPEDRIAAQDAAEPPQLRSVSATGGSETEGSAAEWPGFRGSGRDGVILGVRIATDWSASPPIELWRRSIGPGWSSLAVSGDLLYTQEQRGDDEVVACYNRTTGEPVWRHHDTTKFWESSGGSGPRATPTLNAGRVYTFGATGILNALDASDGTVLWTRNAVSDTEAKVPYYGFSGSPLVEADIVIVNAGKLAAYDLTTGEPRWFGGDDRLRYSSPHLLTLDGVTQILQLSADGASGVALADGALLWEHEWPGYPMIQPAVTADGDLLISISEESGMRRLAVARGADGWTVEERWTSLGLKPYFNDFVVHEGHAFGFDGRILACIDVETGERQWKGGRYGNGQLVLLVVQDLLLVLSEKGDLALVRAKPDQFTEVARFPALDGKTWNHPVLVDDVLLVRNGQEMVAFRLPLSADS